MFTKYGFGGFSPYEPNLTSLFSYGLFVLFLLGVMLIIIAMIGEKRKETWKNRLYECGLDTSVLPVSPQHVPFYLVAIFFIIFDVETAFIVSWAIAFRSLGVTGWLLISFFIFVLLLSLFYLWRKGGLSWRTVPLDNWKKNTIRSSQK